MDVVEVRRERDGMFRYRFRVGDQFVVSRETYQTEAEATAAGEAVRRRTARWAPPVDPETD